jgi:hypothetical protein
MTKSSMKNKTKLKVVPIVRDKQDEMIAMLGRARRLVKEGAIKDLTIVYQPKSGGSSCISSLTWIERTWVFQTHIASMTHSVVCPK